MSTRRYKGTSGRIYEPIEHIGPGGFGAVEQILPETYSTEQYVETVNLAREKGLGQAYADAVLGPTLTRSPAARRATS